MPRLYWGWKNRVHYIALSSGAYQQAASEDYLKFDQSLPSPKVWNTSISYSLIRGQDKYSLFLFHKYYSSLSTYVGSDHRPELRSYGHEGGGHILGGNIFGKKSIGMWELWGSYAYVSGQVRYGQYPTAIHPPYISHHTLKGTVKYWLPQLKTLLASSLSWDAGVDLPGVGSLPNRSRIDLSCSILPHPRWVIHLSVLNVLGQKNYWGVEHSIADPTQYRYVSSPSNRFVYIGCFVTLSSNNKINQNPTKF